MDQAKNIDDMDSYVISDSDPNNTKEKKTSAYFSDYASLEVHKLMLNDKVRTDAYYNAIISQKDYFKDKIVMDVGCGTGILSLFSAKAGAKKVYAVDASNIACLAMEIVKANNLENVIEVIQCQVEKLTLPDNVKVDIIVSEWMGFYLIHEGMLDSVIFARDAFLKEDGRMFPEHAQMYVAPCSIPSLFDQWDDFYGVCMTPFAKKLITNGNKRPEIDIVAAGDLVGPEVEFACLDLKTVKHDELDRLTLKKVIPASRDGSYQGLCVWWKCVFPSMLEDGSQVVLSTSPHDPPTHWKQCLLVPPYGDEVEEDQPIAFELTMYRDQTDMRCYKIEYNMVDPDSMEHPMPCHCHNTKCILAKTFLAHIDNGGIQDDLIDSDQDIEEIS